MTSNIKIISDSALTESKMDSDELALTELIGKQFGLPPPENNSDPALVEKWRQAAKQIIRSTVSLSTTITRDQLKLGWISLSNSKGEHLIKSIDDDLDIYDVITKCDVIFFSAISATLFVLNQNFWLPFKLISEKYVIIIWSIT